MPTCTLSPFVNVDLYHLVHCSAGPRVSVRNRALPEDRTNRSSLPAAVGSAMKAATPQSCSGSPQASEWRDLSLQMKEETRFA
ncbi:hypothetical protein E2C01_044183 [Portunus trituberculatus]|uniref:Uncharacterized protein n=1 Tax=Portunus trituberculatus TaxID=210409 RepID=A0A5B7FYE5_PORTR|nr:hypothetical protein [Portunus trituberculatus]